MTEALTLLHKAFSSLTDLQGCDEVPYPYNQKLDRAVEQVEASIEALQQRAITLSATCNYCGNEYNQDITAFVDATDLLGYLGDLRDAGWIADHDNNDNIVCPLCIENIRAEQVEEENAYGVLKAVQILRIAEQVRP